MVCDAPAVPANGGRIGDEFSFGNTITFFCNGNFTLRGSQSRTCQMNGQFDGVPAVCDPGTCSVSYNNCTCFLCSYPYTGLLLCSSMILLLNSLVFFMKNQSKFGGIETVKFGASFVAAVKTFYVL